jgi:hypothetical protein
MDFKDQIKQLADRVTRLKDNINTEEATKTSLVLPFLQTLGYDVFDPFEVVPEFISDIGTKKGEKVDYAILKEVEGSQPEPCMLIECKHWKQALTLHDNQLLRYFHVTKARFGILTNGITYRFYTDLENANRMDEKPFLEIDLLDLRENQIEELKKFSKPYFDVDQILNTASELKYMGALKGLIGNEFANPSEWIIKYFAKGVYEGQMTAKMVDYFSGLVKKSIAQTISEQITDRLKIALTQEQQEVVTAPTEASPTAEKKEVAPVTTSEELEGFYIVRSILRTQVEAARIVHRDALSYFAILLDDNNRKTICRLHFNGSKKYVGIMDEAKREAKYEIQSLDDIYNFDEQIKQTLAWLITPGVKAD